MYDLMAVYLRLTDVKDYMRGVNDYTKRFQVQFF